MLQIGDQVVISKNPKSKVTVDGFENELAVVVSKPNGGIVMIQLSRLPGKIGQCQVLVEDLLPSGQLRMF